ncbi:MAG: LytR C-terminal domain-containing protein [Mycobacteriales bacterium]
MTGPDTPASGWDFPEDRPYTDPVADDLLEAPPSPVETEVSHSSEAVTEPPSFHVPRRLAVESTPISPVRALAGALVSVAGVLLGIGALMWATEAPGGSPTVTAGQAQLTPLVSASPSTAPSSPAALSPATSPTPTDVASPPAAPKLAITVLNNSRITGLADRAATRFRAGGWPVKDTGNFTGKVNDTTVYYAPGQLASAERLQSSFSGLVRVRPRFSTLPGTGLTVVLTKDYRP